MERKERSFQVMYVFLLEYALYRGADVVFKLRDVPEALEQLGNIASVSIEVVYDDGRRWEVDGELLVRPTKSREEVKAEIISVWGKSDEALKSDVCYVSSLDVAIAERQATRLESGDLPSEEEIDRSRLEFGYEWLSPEELDAREQGIVSQES